MKKSTRTTISIPSELKARMEGIGIDVNWSSVASVAFESKLAEIITKRGTKDVKDVIARLKASKTKVTNKMSSDGFYEGAEWAKNQAEADQLERLEMWAFAATPPGDGYVDALTFRESDAFDGHYHLAVVIIGPKAENCHRSIPDEFWQISVGDEVVASGVTHDPRFLAGFVTGAISVWDAVQGQF